MIEVAKRKGNPNFGSKKEEPLKTNSKSPKKGFHVFKLLQEHGDLKPVDNKTGTMTDDPFPDIYIAPNSGVAFNPDSGEVERWRFLHGYASIWEKDQMTPEPNRQRLDNVDGKNDIIFTRGRLRIQANETAKYAALTVQDIYDGIGENQLNPVPFTYTLIDEAKVTSKIRSNADLAFDAESMARKANFDEMLATAMAFGIDISEADDDEEKVRTAFILKAKANPVLFLKVFNDPTVKIKFLATRALSEGSLVANEGSLTYNGLVIMQVRMDKDIPEQIANATIEGDEKATKLYDTLKSLSL